MLARRFLPLVILGLFMLPASLATAAVTITGPESFGTTRDGTPVVAYTLRADRGVQVKLISLGATIAEWLAPDRQGQLADVVLGFDDVAGYESDRNQYFGCTTGRVCNRIARGRFTLEGKTYTLAINNEPNHLHGGAKRSLDKVVWKSELRPSDAGPSVVFSYTSPDGEEGYPGTVTFSVRYTLSADGALAIRYAAQTDRVTPVNLTNHAYFNLAGAGAASVLDHELTLDAQRYTPTDATLIPTGQISPVEGTPLDFTKPTVIGARIESLIAGPTLGYDHNFVLRPRDAQGQPTFAAKLKHPASGRTLTVLTNEPGIQFYSGNFLHDQLGKQGKKYPLRSAVCLETQHFPDSVNQPEFPSILLQPGQQYGHVCIYRIGAE